MLYNSAQLLQIIRNSEDSESLQSLDTTDPVWKL